MGAKTSSRRIINVEVLSWDRIKKINESGAGMNRIKSGVKSAIAGRKKRKFSTTTSDYIVASMDEWSSHISLEEQISNNVRRVTTDGEKKHLLANLENYGVAIQEKLVDKDEASNLGRKIFEFVDNLEAKSGAESYRLVRPEDRQMSYKEASGSQIPIVIKRGGVDMGMFDIFHLDKLLAEAAGILEKIKQAGLEKIFSELVGTEMKLMNVNAYVNEDITSTRGFHVDSWGKAQFKAFVYLTDVSELADGPYTYVLGTAGNPQFITANQELSANRPKTTDVSVYPSSGVLPILAPAGSLVISNQNGAHRGWPQKIGHKRCILALNFTKAN